MLGPEISAAAFLERLLPMWRSGAARVSDRRFAELLVSERAAILSLIEDALDRRADAPTWMVDRRRLPAAWNDVEPSAAATGPRRWEITLAGDLRVDGVAVCSGPVAGLRALGRELHERGYPRLTREVVEAFRLREPGKGEPVSAGGLSATTQGLIRLLSSAGASEVAVRAYLGLGAAHWRAHQVAPGAQTWLHAELVRMMPLTPTEAAWALESDEPHGWRLALDLLRRTEALGLATQTRPGRWARTEAGEALAREAGGPSDLPREHGLDSLAFRRERDVMAGDAGAHRRTTVIHIADGFQQRNRWRIFHQIAGCTGANGFKHRFIIFFDGQHNAIDIRLFFLDLANAFDA